MKNSLSPTSSEEALDQCEKLWRRLAITGSGDKHETALEVLGYVPIYGCPACEWDFESKDLQGRVCKACPIKAWREDEDNSACMRIGPYKKWVEAYTNEAKREEALAMLQLIKNSKEN